MYMMKFVDNFKIIMVILYKNLFSVVPLRSVEIFKRNRKIFIGLDWCIETQFIQGHQREFIIRNRSFIFF